MLEVWGAQGGQHVTGGGRGGYAKGYISSTANKKYYICVGGTGAIVSNSRIGGSGGYNGGGRGGNGHEGTKIYLGGGGGGGATHIATTNRGVLTSYKSYQNEILMVAGGGGGGWGWRDSEPLGYGGGEAGGDVRTYGGMLVKGGTQTNGYNFGQGQDAIASIGGSCASEGRGGGGGGWYGGYACNETSDNSNCIGAGGSGHVGSMVTNGSMQNGVREGNGYTVITWHPNI